MLQISRSLSGEQGSSGIRPKPCWIW